MLFFVFLILLNNNCCSGGGSTRRGPEDDARNRRATEREGRRARRRRAREQVATLPKHIDGMSSDDEVTEQQNIAFKQTKGIFKIQMQIGFSLIVITDLHQFISVLNERLN